MKNLLGLNCQWIPKIIRTFFYQTSKNVGFYSWVFTVFEKKRRKKQSKAVYYGIKVPWSCKKFRNTAPWSGWLLLKLIFVLFYSIGPESADWRPRDTVQQSLRGDEDQGSYVPLLIVDFKTIEVHVLVVNNFVPVHLAFPFFSLLVK